MIWMHLFISPISLIFLIILFPQATTVFFITTQSQYVISSLLDRSVNELAVYVVDIKDNETVVSRITDGQLQYFRKNGDDLSSLKP